MSTIRDLWRLWVVFCAIALACLSLYYAYNGDYAQATYLLLLSWVGWRSTPREEPGAPRGQEGE